MLKQHRAFLLRQLIWSWQCSNKKRARRFCSIWLKIHRETIYLTRFIILFSSILLSPFHGRISQHRLADFSLSLPPPISLEIVTNYSNGKYFFFLSLKSRIVFQKSHTFFYPICLENLLFFTFVYTVQRVYFLKWLQWNFHLQFAQLRVIKNSWNSLTFYSEIREWFNQKNSRVNDSNCLTVIKIETKKKYGNYFTKIQMNFPTNLACV